MGKQDILPVPSDPPDHAEEAGLGTSAQVAVEIRYRKNTGLSQIRFSSLASCTA